MTKNNRDLEIVISLALILFSFVGVYFIYQIANWQIEDWNRFLIDEFEFSWFRLIISMRSGIISVVLLSLGGVLLLLNKRLGWYSSIIVSINQFVTFLILAITNSNEATESLTKWVGYPLSVLLLCISLFLFTRQVRLKYQVNLKSLIIVLLGVGLLLTDRFLI